MTYIFRQIYYTYLYSLFGWGMHIVIEYSFSKISVNKRNTKSITLCSTVYERKKKIYKISKKQKKRVNISLNSNAHIEIENAFSAIIAQQQYYNKFLLPVSETER